MKKKALIGIVALLLCGSALTACSLDSVINLLRTGEVVETVSYYGCPNSKRVKKLKTEKKKTA